MLIDPAYETHRMANICMSNSGMWSSIGRILSKKEPSVKSAPMMAVAVELLEKGKLERKSFEAPSMVEPETKTEIDEAS